MDYSRCPPRPLTIPKPIDRVVHKAMMVALEATAEPLFVESSHGFRPNRGCHTAFKEIWGWKDVKQLLDMDFVKCFDNLNQGILFNLISEQIREPELLALFDQCIHNTVINEDGKPQYTLEKGIAQGVPLSPLLMNIYLNVFDHFMIRLKQRLQQRGQPSFQYIRYADNFLLGAQADMPKTVMKQIRSFIREDLQLDIKGNLRTRGVFLGYVISLQGGRVWHMALMKAIRTKIRGWERLSQKGPRARASRQLRGRCEAKANYYKGCRNEQAVQRVVRLSQRKTRK